MIRLIAAIDSKRGIARQGAMPWKIPEDEQYFTEQTKLYGGHVLTGGATFREAYHERPLAGRTNYILTRQKLAVSDTVVVHDLAAFLGDFANKDLWVAGGADVFRQVMELGRADELYLTHIEGDFDCDRFFPEYSDKFVAVERTPTRVQNGFAFYYARYQKAR